MAIRKFAGYAEGSDIGGEPINWVVYDTDTNTSHIEWNPNYVPPPPLTEIENAKEDVEEARRELFAREEYLKALLDEEGVE